MPKGYWIANNTVSDVAEYDKYRAAVAAYLSANKARFLIRAGSQEVMEGTAHPRTIVIEFPSYEEAVNCYNSAEYQEIRKIRLGASDINLIIVEGYDG